jgi:hypothetical protein
MAYTLSIPLENKEKKEDLISAFEFPYGESKEFVKLSSKINEHDYPKKVKNGIFISYKTYKNDVKYYLEFYAQTITIRYGLKKICKINKKEYPYYYLDSRLVFVIPENDISDFNEFLMYENFNIVVYTEVDNINIFKHVERKMDINDQDFKNLFGDNDLLKINCNELLKRLNKI